MGFDSFVFLPPIAAGVRDAGYVTPTPIQAQAIPAVLAGRDVLGLAQTGTGKTAAFMLPILQRLLPTGRGAVRALIVAPTRELAEQIHEAAGTLGRHTPLRSAAIYGGVGIQLQVQKLRAGVDIVVACPGRLLDHLAQRTIDLSRVEVLVLDEADHMLDMGFLPDIRRVLRQLPPRRQNLLFSATMPADIRGLAHEILRDPVTVQVNIEKPIHLVSHALFPVPAHLKTALLLRLLAHTDTDSVLIFTRTKHRAKRLGEQIAKAGLTAASLQGNLSQNRRQEALDGFRDGRFQVLVATDIAARGIDVSSVSHVINYDIPSTVDAYTHRIGRTGRAAKTGDAFSFISQEDDDTVRAIERVLGARIERRTLPDFDYKAAAPRTDSEFARPPRPSRPPPRGPGKAGAAGPHSFRSPTAVPSTPAGRPPLAGSGSSRGGRGGGTPGSSQGGWSR